MSIPQLVHEKGQITLKLDGREYNIKFFGPDGRLVDVLNVGCEISTPLGESGLTTSIKGHIKSWIEEPIITNALQTIDDIETKRVEMGLPELDS